MPVSLDVLAPPIERTRSHARRVIEESVAQFPSFTRVTVPSRRSLMAWRNNASFLVPLRNGHQHHPGFGGQAQGAA